MATSRHQSDGFKLRAFASAVNLNDCEVRLTSVGTRGQRLNLRSDLEVRASCLFVAQRADGIEPRRPPRWNEARCCGDENKQHRDGDEHHGVCGARFYQ